MAPLKSKAIWIVPSIVLGIVILAGLYPLLHRPAVDLDAIKGTSVALNGAQKKEMMPLPSDAIPVVRYRTREGYWQVSVGGQVPAGAKSLMEVGKVSRTRHLPDWDQPIYLCAYRGFKPTALSLDNRADCSGGGKQAGNGLVGYASSVIRTGFLLTARCITPHSGMYLSPNLHCEDPQDRWDGNIGALRAGSVD